MNKLEIIVTLIITGSFMIYSMHCLFVLRSLLQKHGKLPCSPIFSGAMLQYTKLTRELLQNMKEEDDIMELKSALQHTDVSMFLTFVIFFVLAGTFMAIRK